MLGLFNKHNISAKLNTFLVLPIIALLFFFCVTIFDKYDKIEQSKEALQFAQVVQQFSDLIYNLQKERGLSAGMLAAKNPSYQFQLAEQRKITANTYEKISYVFSFPPHYLPEKTIDNFKQIEQKFKKLKIIRTEVDNLIDNNLFDFYSGLISDLLQEINVLHAMVTNQEINYMVSSLIYALGLEEYAAIERGLLYGALSEQQHNNAKRDKLILMGVVNHVARQQAELIRYYNVASPKHSTLMIETIKDKKIQEYHQYESNFGIVTDLKQENASINTIQQNVNSDSGSAFKTVAARESVNTLMDPELWWQSATYRLGLLHTVSSTIINDILAQERLANKALKTPLVFYTVFILIVFVITILLSQILKKRLVEEIKHIAYVMKKARTHNKSNELLDISGQDEIAVMANEFNQLMIERSENEEQLKLAAQFFIEAHDGIFIMKTDGTIININPAFSEITGYGRKDVLGRNLNILNSEKQSKQFYHDIWECVIARGYWKGEVWNCKKNGELYAELLTISSLKDNSGKTLHYMGLFADITQIKNQHHTLEQMAHYDALTLLPNRTLFIDRFNQAVAHADRMKSSLAICFIDLDNFKPINDNYGHSIGDKILIEVANRIKSNLRTGDTVSRQGGDEFALLLSDIQTFGDCEDILKRIYTSLTQPFIYEDISYVITASTGVTLYPNDHSDLDTLIRHADQAMYQIKLSGGNGYHLFNKEKDQQIINKRQQLNKILEAINNDEFVLYYQPKVNMKTGTVYGVEALVRWISPENGLIPPKDFLPILEGTNEEVLFGQWVINNAIKQLVQWQKAGLMIEVSINISSFHLQSATFVSDLKDILSNYETLNTNYIQLEILESSVLGDLNTIKTTLNACRKQFGLNIALDDFGTGYSSLTHIKSLPANVIKIDQSFVIDMLNDANNYSIINGVLGLANSFNRDVIAEGVETTEHGLMLLMMGCEKAQGYSIARPMPANEFNNWLITYQPNKDWLIWASKVDNQKESKLKVFDIALRHEYTSLSQRLLSPFIQADEPIKQEQNTVCKRWIKRKKQSTIFCNAWLTELEDAYQLMYHKAEELYLQHANDEINNVVLSTEKLKKLFHNVINIMSKIN